MRKLVAIGTLAAMALGAQAAAAAEGISYNLIEGQYITGDEEGVDFDGPGLHGSFGFTPMFHAFGEWKDFDLDGGGSLGLLSAGLGLNTAINEMWSFFGRASFERIDVGPSESGWGIAAGVRGLVIPQLELSGMAKYSDVGDAGDFTTFVVGGRWYLGNNFALGVDYNILDGDGGDSDFWTLALRYDFGQM